jgi:hypothetical protein
LLTSSAAVLLIFTSGALLNHFEPETFKTFWDGAWFSLTTVTTVGYGDLTPKTAAGRIITTGLIVCGISLFGVFLGLSSELVRAKLLKQEGNLEVTALRIKVRKLMAEQAETRRMLGRMEAQNTRIESQNGELNALVKRLVEDKGETKVTGEKVETPSPTVDTVSTPGSTESNGADSQDKRS